MSVSKDKMVTMFMKGSMAVRRRPYVCMNWNPVRYVESVKHLGIRVSEKMYFKVHFERMRVKMTNVWDK